MTELRCWNERGCCLHLLERGDNIYLNFASGAGNMMTDWLSALYTLLAQIQAHANKQTHEWTRQHACSLSVVLSGHFMCILWPLAALLLLDKFTHVGYVLRVRYFMSLRWFIPNDALCSSSFYKLSVSITIQHRDKWSQSRKTRHWFSENITYLSLAFHLYWSFSLESSLLLWT